MGLITSNQFPLMFLCFLLGSAGAVLIWRRPRTSRAWKAADVVWIGLGGFGALVAVAAGIYKTDSFRIERQIDLAYAVSRAFDRDAARFRLRYCDGPGPVAGPLLLLCEKVEFLSASSAINQELPLFLGVTAAATPLQGLHFLPGAAGEAKMSDAAMLDMADAFDAEALVAFTPRDAATDAASAELRQDADGVGVAADFQVLTGTYGELIDEVRKLKEEWEVLRANEVILAIQVLALCLVAFAAPFRLGKSIKDLG
ncbi:MAG: hypothetical protein WBA91_07375 [Paracoccaceae bacterium]